MDSEQSRTKNTGRRLIIFLVRLVRPAENVAVQKGAARKAAPFCLSEHQLDFWWRRGKGISSVIDPRACAAGRHAGRYPFKETCKRG